MFLVTRDTPRQIKFTPNVNPYADGSVLAEFGKTKVLITVTCESDVPFFLKDKTGGWLTAEYAMLPRSTHTRSSRERKGASGRTKEIERLIGRSLRAAVDLEKLGRKTIIIDCDVLVADGGTRTASISGAFVALSLAIDKMIKEGSLKSNPIIHNVGAISIGIDSKNQIIADLDYVEDSSCHTDMNLVITDQDLIIEIQGTAEGSPFAKEQLDLMVQCAKTALKEIFEQQKKAIEK